MPLASELHSPVRPRQLYTQSTFNHTRKKAKIIFQTLFQKVFLLTSCFHRHSGIKFTPPREAFICCWLPELPNCCCLRKTVNLRCRTGCQRLREKSRRRQITLWARSPKVNHVTVQLMKGFGVHWRSICGQRCQTASLRERESIDAAEASPPGRKKRGAARGL